MKGQVRTEKRLASLGLVLLMLLTMVAVAFPVTASAKSRTITLYANHPDCTVKSKTKEVHDNAPNYNFDAIMGLSYDEFEVSGNYTIKNFNSKADGTGRSYILDREQSFDQNTTALYAQWVDGFEGQEIIIHSKAYGYDGESHPKEEDIPYETKVVKADKHGFIKMPSNTAFLFDGKVISSWETKREYSHVNGELTLKSTNFAASNYEDTVNLREDLKFKNSWENETYSDKAQIFTELYANWSVGKIVNIKNNAGETVITKEYGIDYGYGGQGGTPHVYFEGLRDTQYHERLNKIPTGLTTLPNGDGDWYMPFSSYSFPMRRPPSGEDRDIAALEALRDLPDTLYLQEADIPKSDYVLFYPAITSVDDSQKLTNKYVTVNHSGGTMPPENSFGENVLVAGWDNTFWGGANYAPGLPFSQTIIDDPKHMGGTYVAKAGKLPIDGYFFYGALEDNPYNVTTTINADGSKETKTVKDDGTVMELKVNTDGSGTATSAMPDGSRAETKIEKTGEITSTVSVPSSVSKAKIEISLPELKDGTVAIAVDKDGDEKIIKKTVAGNYSLIFEVEESCEVKITDNSKKFSDVSEGHWFSKNVDFASARDLFKGTGGDKFSPAAGMNRAMFVTVIWRLENEPDGGSTSFDDVAGGTYYEEAAAWASKEGIVTGVGNNNFAPASRINRETLVTMMYRYAKSIGKDTSASGSSNFSDSDDVSTWAKDAMNWAIANKIIQGSDGKIKPQGYASRAEASAILQRFVKVVLK